MLLCGSTLRKTIADCFKYQGRAGCRSWAAPGQSRANWKLNRQALANFAQIHRIEKIMHREAETIGKLAAARRSGGSSTSTGRQLDCRSAHTLAPILRHAASTKAEA